MIRDAERDRFSARRVMDRILGRPTITRGTRLFRDKTLAESARAEVIVKTNKTYTPVRRYSGGVWGFEEDHG